MKKRFGNCYFEFHVQILVTPGGLQNGAHNIFPLGIQFQMLSVTNRGVGCLELQVRKGGYRGTPIEDPYFIPDLKSFRLKQN